MKTTYLKQFSFTMDGNVNNRDVYLVRRILNYSLLIFSNYKKVNPLYVEKTIKRVYELLKLVRNSEIERDCLFIYWLLHEILFSFNNIDSQRIKSGISNILKIGSYFGISVKRSESIKVPEDINTREPLFETSGV